MAAKRPSTAFAKARAAGAGASSYAEAEPDTPSDLAEMP